MKRAMPILFVGILFICSAACSTSYKAKPLSFKLPNTYPKARKAAGATVAAKAYVDAKEAGEAFGFDVRRAGMLPVQVVIDNQGPHFLEINGPQSFLDRHCYLRSYG